MYAVKNVRTLNRNEKIIVHNHGLTERHLDILRSVLLPFSKKIEKVGLFGSRATGLYRYNSDIDLVIYGRLEESDIDRIFTLLDCSNLPFNTDVQAYDLISYLPIRKHIDENMILLFSHEQLVGMTTINTHNL